MLKLITLLTLPCALVLGACGGGNAVPTLPVRTDFAQPTQITGKISDYNKMKGTLGLLDKTGTVITSAVVSTTGEFTVDLPNAAGAAKINDKGFQNLVQYFLIAVENCTGNITLSNVEVRVSSLSTLRLVQGNAKRTLASTILNMSSDAVYKRNLSILLYAFGTVSLTCEKHCTTGVLTSNLHLKPG